MRASMLIFVLSVGSCSQYEVMYSGQVNQTKASETAGMKDNPSSPTPRAKVKVIRGDCNANVWISEIHADPQYIPDRHGEYIELYNPNTIPIRLNGWRISDQKRDGHTLRSQKTIEIAAQAYFVLGINANKSTNGDLGIDYQYKRFNLSNTQDSIRLEDACGNLIQEVIYPDAWGQKKMRAGFAMERIADKKSGDTQGWKRARNRLKSGERGTPGTGPWPIKRRQNPTNKRKKKAENVDKKGGIGALTAPRATPLPPTPWPTNGTKQTKHPTTD